MAKTNIFLSVIIPAYNAEPYLSELLDRLAPQMTKECECIVIVDGSKVPVVTSYPWVKLIRQENKGVNFARNLGIDKAKGKYIQFIDADDLVSEDFVEKIVAAAADKDPDVIEFSWRSLEMGHWNCDVKLSSQSDRLPNPSVCTRTFKRSYIGDVRFSLLKDSTEDEDFCRKMGYLDPESDFKRVVIPNYLYFYRDTVPNSKSKRYAAGLMNTKRIVYFYNHVTKDMTWLLDEIKKEDEINEVILMTYQNDIPELKKYCQVTAPKQCWGHELRGEPYKGLTKKQTPLRTQVVIFRLIIPKVGGIGTFTEHFINALSDKYDITICCQCIDIDKYRLFSQKVRVLTNEIKYDNHKSYPNKFTGQVVCDSLIVVSFLDNLPTNIHAKKIVRMCHACKTDPTWQIPKDYDVMAYVSETARQSHGATDGVIIHNMNFVPDKKALILVSATRLPAPDKGKIEERMRRLAQMLNDKGLPFIWLNFSNGKMEDPPKNFFNMGPSKNMQSIIASATYVVQLSDSECFSYTCLEALMNNTPIICTPFPSAFEMGIKDKVNAHIVTFDMEFDVEQLYNVPEFTFTYDNEAIKNQWIEILGHTTPKHDYIPSKLIDVKILNEFTDINTGAMLKKGDIVSVTEERAAEMFANLGERYVKILGGL